MCLTRLSGGVRRSLPELAKIVSHPRRPGLPHCQTQGQGWTA
ncbi:hypothetical protein BN2537_485 [Streptomyces venezuelae]|nr:hypothetical protein BN2537_485 [Streptomyces venezuelae]